MFNWPISWSKLGHILQKSTQENLLHCCSIITETGRIAFLAANHKKKQQADTK